MQHPALVFLASDVAGSMCKRDKWKFKIIAQMKLKLIYIHFTSLNHRVVMQQRPQSTNEYKPIFRHLLLLIATVELPS